MTQEHKEMIGGLSILTVLVLIFCWVCAPREVDGYYVSVSDSSLHMRGGETCIYSHWTWKYDEMVTCGNNKDMVEMVEKLNMVARTVGGRK